MIPAFPPLFPSSKMNMLQEKFPGLDPDTLDYIISIARDTSMTASEKSEIINEHLGSLGFSDERLVTLFIEEEVRKAREEETQRRLQQAKNVGAYIEVIRSTAPQVTEPADHTEETEDKLIKQHLLRQYDPDELPGVPAAAQQKGRKKNGSKEESQNNSEDEELIYGLGANENKLFKVKQREEMKAKAKAEQEEARALKVQQKLKQQGNEIKSTSKRK